MTTTAGHALPTAIFTNRSLRRAARDALPILVGVSNDGLTVVPCHAATAAAIVRLAFGLQSAARDALTLLVGVASNGLAEVLVLAATAIVRVTLGL